MIDDHVLIRQMWIEMFSDNNDIIIIGECGTLREAIEMVRDKRPDIVLLDINLPDASGLEAVSLLSKYSAATAIIAVSFHNQPLYAKEMLRLGAKGYVTKNSSHLEILNAIEEVMKGNLYICTEIKNIQPDLATITTK